MICRRQGLRNYKYKQKHKYIQQQIQEKRQIYEYDVICFWKEDDKRSVIMQNMQNMHNMQSRQYAEYAKYAKYGEYAEYDEYADNAKYGKDAKYFLFRFSSPNIFLLFPLCSYLISKCHEVQSPMSPFNLADLFSLRIWSSFFCKD